MFVMENTIKFTEWTGTIDRTPAHAILNQIAILNIGKIGRTKEPDAQRLRK